MGGSSSKKEEAVSTRLRTAPPVAVAAEPAPVDRMRRLYDDYTYPSSSVYHQSSAPSRPPLPSRPPAPTATTQRQSSTLRSSSSSTLQPHAFVGSSVSSAYGGNTAIRTTRPATSTTLMGRSEPAKRLAPLRPVSVDVQSDKSGTLRASTSSQPHAATSITRQPIPSSRSDRALARGFDLLDKTLAARRERSDVAAGALSRCTVSTAPHQPQPQNNAVVSKREDRDARSIRIQSIKLAISEDELRLAFRRFGEVVSAKVLKHRGKNAYCGYAFVNFADERSARNAAEICPCSAEPFCSFAPGGLTLLESSDSCGESEFSAQQQQVRCSLYVGNLAEHVCDVDLRDEFAPFGPVLGAMIVCSHDASRTSRGFGFVDLETVEMAAAAVTVMNETTSDELAKVGKKLIVKMKTDRGKEFDADCEVCVKGFGPSVLELELFHMFKMCGVIILIKVLRDKNGIQIPVGFVRFQSKGQAERAVQRMHGKATQDGRLLIVAPSRSRPARQSSSGNSHPQSSQVCTSSGGGAAGGGSGDGDGGQSGKGGKAAAAAASAASSRDEKDDDYDECKICYQNKIDCVILPCGHLACCYECANQLHECAYCRQQIASIARTYRP